MQALAKACGRHELLLQHILSAKAATSIADRARASARQTALVRFRFLFRYFSGKPCFLICN